MSTLDTILKDATTTLEAVSSLPDLEQVKARYLGKSGSLTEQLKALGKLSPEEKRTAGAAINLVKTHVEALIAAAKQRIANAALEARLASEAIDVTLPGRNPGIGGLHPVTRALERIEALFATMGFSVADGPVTLHTRILSSAQDWRKRSNRADECSGPWPS